MLTDKKIRLNIKEFKETLKIMRENYEKYNN